MTTKDYAAIAASKIHRPASVTRPPRIQVYSRNKKGKTRLSTTAPDVLVLDPEGGTDTMKKINPPVWPVESWQEFNDVYHYLKGGKHPYQWVAVDGCTKFSNMALRFVMGMAEERDLERKPGMVQKQDYGKAGELMKGMLHNFHSLDMGVIFTCQERMMENSESGDEDEDSENNAALFVPDLPKGVRGSLNSIVDVTGRLYTVRVAKRIRNESGRVVETDDLITQRRLWLEPSAAYDTGYRSDYELPRYIKNPTIPKLVELMLTGSIATRKGPS